MGQTIDPNSSQIAFYGRVLDEARDEANPLLERVKFLSILGTIAEEFVAGGHVKASQLAGLLDQARSYLLGTLVPELAATGIHILRYSELTSHQRQDVDRFFELSVLPLLMPLGFDAARPFPHISGHGVALAVIVEAQSRESFACVEIPEAIAALVPTRHRDGDGFVWLHEIVSANLGALFPDTRIVAAHPFKLLRDTNIEAAPTGGRSLREAVEAGLRRREFGDAVALTVTDAMPRALVEQLMNHLAIDSTAVATCATLIDLPKLAQVACLERPALRHEPLVPHTRAASVFDEIRRRDVLLHHPYDSFQTVIDFIAEAAIDPDVLAISTTLYRAGKNSPIVEALLAARRNGKRVRVVVELRARFDEAHNLAWGYALEQAGAHVVYGTVAYKVHAKTTLIVRREAGRLRSYVHLSSGNYNPATAAAYTDLGLLTCREDIAHDASQLFNAISGYGAPAGFRRLLVAPLTLRANVIELIERESGWAAHGKPAHIILKMNALSDSEIIEHLYLASQTGVRIDLIVRGICCLQPGVPGISDNIRVRSIVGRFLEHSRAWYFRNGGAEEVYIGSADLMRRNLHERVEVMVPVEDAVLKRRVHREILGAYLADNVKAREMQPDGQYVRICRNRSEAALNSQECFQ